MRRTAALLATLGLIAPAPAAARSYWSRAYPIAVAYWHRVPCGGNVTVKWSSAYEYGAWAAWTAADASGAPDQDCTITYSPSVRWNWTSFCNVTAHEVGHLLGYHHTTAFSVMNPDWSHKRSLLRCAPR